MLTVLLVLLNLTNYEKFYRKVLYHLNHTQIQKRVELRLMNSLMMMKPMKTKMIIQQRALMQLQMMIVIMHPIQQVLRLMEQKKIIK